MSTPYGPQDWKKEWKDMPEYEMTQKLPHREIIMRFRSQEDLEAFFELLGQNVTERTKSAWYPKVTRGRVCQHANKVYTDES